MSEDAVADALAEARAAEGAEDGACKVTALGHDNGVYYFIGPSGQRRDLKPRQLTTYGDLISLFDGDGKWLVDHHGKRDKNDEPTGEIKIAEAGAALMRRCVRAGLYDPAMAVRSYGVWRGPRDSVLAHCGGTLIYFDASGQRRRAQAGLRLPDALYLAAPPIEPPDDVEASAAECATVFAAIRDLWNFNGAHLPRLVFGFIPNAMLGAAPAWRVHVLLTGAPGKAGKTHLLNLIGAALGAQGNTLNDPTEAGLREWLSNQGRAVLYDEAGGRQGGDESRSFLPVTAIIGLLRRMADAEGAHSVRGSGGGGVKHYRMAGAAALAAANPPILDEQDRTRILEVDLKNADPNNRAKVLGAIEDTAQLSAKLRARALRGWGRFGENLHVYRAALIAQNCDARQADQLGTLLAAAEMMLSDEAIDADSAADEIAALKPVIQEFIVLGAELSNGRQCYGALMSAQIEHWKGGVKSTVGRLVEMARDPTAGDARAALAVHGLIVDEMEDVVGETDEGRPIRAVRRDNGGRGAILQQLVIANQHDGLKRIFRGTPWENGAWRRALLQLPKAEAGDPRLGPKSFAGYKSRWIALPERYLPDKPAPEPPI